MRNARKEANDEIKSAKDDGLSEDEAKAAETNVQQLTDGFVKRIEERVSTKEADIMTV